LIAYTTAPNELAKDNGGYARSLARHLLTPGQSPEVLFRQVASDISSETFGKQVPWYQSSITDEFFLLKSVL
jgi:uncharacterized caspase-like protein